MDIIHYTLLGSNPTPILFIPFGPYLFLLYVQTHRDKKYCKKCLSSYIIIDITNANNSNGTMNSEYSDKHEINMNIQIIESTLHLLYFFLRKSKLFHERDSDFAGFRNSK